MEIGSAAGLDAFGLVIGLLGGLALFLLGMDQLTGALKALAGDGMRRLLGGLTTNRVMAALTGAAVTAVIQSSSVTTVLVVGFISAGLMSLGQSVGVIMGANVGTTLTAQVIAFQVTEYALLLIALGFGTWFGARPERVRESGRVVMGLGLVFFGMDLMGEATAPLRSFDPFIELMRGMNRPLLGIAAAAAFTALVQSSSATTGIVIVLASQGFITLEAGIGLALGANLGTCATALLAALGKPRPAVQAAIVHVLFNLLGVLLWVGLIGELAELVRRISPAHPDLAPSLRLAAETPRQVANAHTLFNLANALLFLPFSGPIAHLVERIVPERAEEDPARPRFLDPILLGTPALALDRLRLEIAHLGERVHDLVGAATVVPGGPSVLDGARVARSVRSIESLYRAILGYARQIPPQLAASADADQLARLLVVANHFHNMADTIALNLGDLAREWDVRRLRASEETSHMLEAFCELVVHSVSDAVRVVREEDAELATRVIAQKPVVAARAEALERHLADRLLAPDPHRRSLFRLESTVIEIFKRLFYFAKRVARAFGPEVDAIVLERDG